MAILYFVRHGQTEHNANHIIQGQIDSSLTELGIAQAVEAAEKLKNTTFAACYHSPLGRTTTTAQTILQHHDIPVYIKPELMEFNMGILEGKINDHTIHGEAFENFAKFPDRYTTPIENGETYTTLTKRVQNCCREIAASHAPEANVLIVTHGGPIRSIVNPLINKPLRAFWLDPDVTPASISMVRWDKDSAPELLTFADIAREAITYNFEDLDQTSIIRPN